MSLRAKKCLKIAGVACAVAVLVLIVILLWQFLSGYGGLEMHVEKGNRWTCSVTIGACDDVHIRIPRYMNGRKVTAIGVFNGSKIKSIKIPDSVTSISIYKTRTSFKRSHDRPRQSAIPAAEPSSIRDTSFSTTAFTARRRSYSQTHARRPSTSRQPSDR